MPRYHRMGEIPRKRHSIFRRDDGALHTEELVGSRGFSGPSSLLYHLQRPTSVVQIRTPTNLDWHTDENPTLRLRHMREQFFVSFGSCSFQEPIAETKARNLL